VKLTAEGIARMPVGLADSKTRVCHEDVRGQSITSRDHSVCVSLLDTVSNGTPS
jgi:hypothetical protein